MIDAMSQVNKCVCRREGQLFPPVLRGFLLFCPTPRLSFVLSTRTTSLVVRAAIQDKRSFATPAERQHIYTCLQDFGRKAVRRGETTSRKSLSRPNLVSVATEKRTNSKRHMTWMRLYVGSESGHESIPLLIGNMWTIVVFALVSECPLYFQQRGVSQRAIYQHAHM